MLKGVSFSIKHAYHPIGILKQGIIIITVCKDFEYTKDLVLVN